MRLGGEALGGRSGDPCPGGAGNGECPRRMGKGHAGSTKKPGGVSRSHLTVLDTERIVEMDRTFGEPLDPRVYRGGFKHIVWEPHEGVGYECDDEAALQHEAKAVGYDMARLVEATKDAIASLSPCREVGPD